MPYGFGLKAAQLLLEVVQVFLRDPVLGLEQFDPPIPEALDLVHRQVGVQQDLVPLGGFLRRRREPGLLGDLFSGLRGRHVLDGNPLLVKDFMRASGLAGRQRAARGETRVRLRPVWWR